MLDTRTYYFVKIDVMKASKFGLRIKASVT